MSTIPQYIARFYHGDINETVKNAFEACVIGMYSSETDKQKVRLMLDQASWKPQAAESKRKGPEREKEEKPKEEPETRLEGTVAEQITNRLRQLLKDGADKNSVALGLAGVGTAEAMALREQLLKDGAHKDYVAQGLAGVNNEAASAFRKEFFGATPSLEAKSFQTGWSVTDGIVCRYGFEEYS